MLTLQVLHYMKETIKPTGPFETMPHEPRHPGKGAKPDHVIQLNCREVYIRASYKTTRRWENFNNRGTKNILLSDEPWLVANNSKSFANRSKSISNNLGLMIFGSDRKKQWNSTVWQKKVMSEKNHRLQHRGGKQIRHSFAK